MPCDLKMNRAVFLDRDGTSLRRRTTSAALEDVVIFPGAAAALGRLQRAGFKLFIVSNQSGVGRGYFTLADVEKVNEHLLRELGREQVRFEKVYIAPEAPEAPSRGRKPSPQFLLDARDEFGVDLAQSYMIGDKLIDLECGWNAGVRKCLLVRTGTGRSWSAGHAEKLGGGEWMICRGGGMDSDSRERARQIAHTAAKRPEGGSSVIPRASRRQPHPCSVRQLYPETWRSAKLP